MKVYADNTGVGSVPGLGSQAGLNCGSMHAPLKTSQGIDIQVNCFNIIPKNYQPKKWSLIVVQEGRHDNGIKSEICSFTTISGQALLVVKKLVSVAEMAKFELESAYAFPSVPGQQESARDSVLILGYLVPSCLC